MLVAIDRVMQRPSGCCPLNFFSVGQSGKKRENDFLSDPEFVKNTRDILGTRTDNPDDPRMVARKLLGGYQLVSDSAVDVVLRKKRDAKVWGTSEDASSLAEFFSVNLAIMGRNLGSSDQSKPTVTLRNTRNKHWLTVLDPEAFPFCPQQVIPQQMSDAEDNLLKVCCRIIANTQWEACNFSFFTNAPRGIERMRRLSTSASLALLEQISKNRSASMFSSLRRFTQTERFYQILQSTDSIETKLRNLSTLEKELLTPQMVTKELRREQSSLLIMKEMGLQF